LENPFSCEKQNTLGTLGTDSRCTDFARVSILFPVTPFEYTECIECIECIRLGEREWKWK